MDDTGARRLEQVEAIFAEVIERPPAERETFLAGACGGDAALRNDVERLLAADGRHAGLLDAAPWHEGREPPEVHVTADPIARPGARIGRYRLLAKISTGGMGTVWLAERADEQFDQRVAVKLIKRGMDTEEILRRFRTERQVLAAIQHPNIARLLDGGAAEDGRPYLVMDFIDGRPIDLYCEAANLTLRQRIELFIKVCRAVQVAHRNLVVHRDLKPSNILVTGQGEPKLLDFGIAKLLSDEGGVATATGMRVMTPLYASPEQVSGDRITTASDVYSLGVILYELLTGRRPYELDTEARSEVERAVLYQEPRRPSTTVGDRALAGDLDTIVLKAMSKTPEGRYGSPEQLAEDLQRYLDGRPILARPTGIGTRVVKALRRNRRTVTAAAAAGAVSILLAIVVSAYLFIVPLWVKDHLDAARLELLDPEQSTVIYIAVYTSDSDAGDIPSSQSLRRALGHYDAALRLQPARKDVRLEREVVRQAAGLPAALDPATMDDRSRGLLAMLTGDCQGAFEAWSGLDLVSTPDPLVEGLLGVLYLATDEPARAYPLLRSAYRELPETGFLCLNLAEAAARCGDPGAALELLERAKGLQKLDDRTGGPTRVEADVLAAAGRYQEAAAVYQQALFGNPVASLHYADMLDGLGRSREALTVLTTGMGTVVHWIKVNRAFVDRADLWWAGLDDEARRRQLDARRVDDPADMASFSALLLAYRVATLSIQKAGPPVVPQQRPPGPPPAVAPSLAELTEPIPLEDLKAWVGCYSGAVKGPLADRIREELAGPNRTLSAATRRDLAAWEREYRSRKPALPVRYRFGFVPD